MGGVFRREPARGLADRQLVTDNFCSPGFAIPNSAMTGDIPDQIAADLEFNPNKEVQDEHIVAVFVGSNRPYLSRKQVQGEIGLSGQGTRDRLNDLEERGVLASEPAGGGRIYWLADDRSAWPIPPDVEVEPIKDELTVNELLARVPVQFVGTGLLLMIGGALLTTLFTLALAYKLSVPLIDTQSLLLAGILAVFFGLAFCGGGAAVWGFERVRDTCGAAQGSAK